MKKIAFLLIVPCALLLGILPASAQEKTTTPTSTREPSASTAAMWNNFQPETLSGTVSMIEPSEKSVFVTGSSGVSYKFLVTRKTKIEIGGTASSFEDLVSQTQKQITVTFVARPSGNFAKSITISG